MSDFTRLYLRYGLRPTLVRITERKCAQPFRSEAVRVYIFFSCPSWSAARRNASRWRLVRGWGADCFREPTTRSARWRMCRLPSSPRSPIFRAALVPIWAARILSFLQKYAYLSAASHRTLFQRTGRADAQIGNQTRAIVRSNPFGRSWDNVPTPFLYSTTSAFLGKKASFQRSVRKLSNNYLQNLISQILPNGFDRTIARMYIIIIPNELNFQFVGVARHRAGQEAIFLQKCERNYSRKGKRGKLQNKLGTNFFEWRLVEFFNSEGRGEGEVRGSGRGEKWDKAIVQPFGDNFSRTPTRFVRLESRSQLLDPNLSTVLIRPNLRLFGKLCRIVDTFSRVYRYSNRVSEWGSFRIRLVFQITRIFTRYKRGSTVRAMEFGSGECRQLADSRSTRTPPSEGKSEFKYIHIHIIMYYVLTRENERPGTHPYEFIESIRSYE